LIFNMNTSKAVAQTTSSNRKTRPYPVRYRAPVAGWAFRSLGGRATIRSSLALSINVVGSSLWIPSSIELFQSKWVSKHRRSSIVGKLQSIHDFWMYVMPACRRSMRMRAATHSFSITPKDTLIIDSFIDLSMSEHAFLCMSLNNIVLR
jgi:hypothetical protein